MFPKRNDMAYFNTPALWFAGVIIQVLGPCRLCPDDPEHSNNNLYKQERPDLGVMPQGPYYKVMIKANGYVYSAIVFEHDRALGGWLVQAVNDESNQLKQALEWTFYQGPPHLARTPTPRAHERYVGHGPWNNAIETPPWTVVEEADNRRGVTPSPARG